MKKKHDDNVVSYPNGLDTRVALLEMSISHINETLIRMDKRLDSIDNKIDRLGEKLDQKIDSRFFWLLTLQISSFVGLLGVIARVAHWI